MFLKDRNSGYDHISHILGRHDFKSGISHVVWNLLLNIYIKIIPSKNFLYYLKEAEWRFKIRDLTNKEKLEYLF